MQNIFLFIVFRIEDKPNVNVNSKNPSSSRATNSHTSGNNSQPHGQSQNDATKFPTQGNESQPNETFEKQSLDDGTEKKATSNSKADCKKEDKH